MKLGGPSVMLTLIPLMPQSFADNWASPVEVHVYQSRVLLQ